jgi:hypothetical protein
VSKPFSNISVGIPTVRAKFIPVVLRAFELGDMLPAEVVLVSNEIKPLDIGEYEFPVRILRFDSEVYAYGFKDWALRRNIGVWAADAPNIMCFDDDEIPQPDLIAQMNLKLAANPYVWGHHRFTDFGQPPPGEEDALIRRLHAMPASAGRSREGAANHVHLWLSGYGGLFACSASLLKSMGGFDMAHNGRGGEDQACARQLSQFCGGDGKIFVHEPPFAWVSHERIPIERIESNLCPNHDYEEVTRAGMKRLQCRHCPYGEFPGLQPQPHILMPFDCSAVQVHQR